jgi:hypothetical protein
MKMIKGEGREKASVPLSDSFLEEEPAQAGQKHSGRK